MNANELLTLLHGECKNHEDCSGCTFCSQEDCVRKCKIMNLTGGLNPLNVEFSGDYPEEKRIKRQMPTINIKNVYICKRENDN